MKTSKYTHEKYIEKGEWNKNNKWFDWEYQNEEEEVAVVANSNVAAQQRA